MILGGVVLGLRTSCPPEQLVLGPRVPLRQLSLSVIGLQVDVSRRTAWLHATFCMRVLVKLFLNDTSLVLRLHIQLPIAGKVMLVLSVWGRSYPGRGHLVLGP